MNKGVCVFLVLGFALLPGCSKPRYTYEVQEDLAAAGLRTVALDPRADLVLLVDGKPLGRAKGFGPLLVRELEQKGYRRVASEDADLWVDVFRKGEQSGERAGEGGPGSREEGMGGGGMPDGGMPGGRGGPGGGMHGGPGGGGRPGGGMRGGPGGAGGGLALLVRMMDRKTQQLVWSGILNLDAKGKGGPGGRPPVEEELRRFLEPLPPAETAPR